jgi:hypothetical protein
MTARYLSALVPIGLAHWSGGWGIDGCESSGFFHTFGVEGCFGGGPVVSLAESRFHHRLLAFSPTGWKKAMGYRP